MAILKVDTITSADTPTVSITDGASISGVTTFSSDITLTNSNHVTQVLKAGGSTSDLQIQFKDSSGNVESAIFCASDSGDLRFKTGGTNERLRINSTGHLSLGGSNVTDVNLLTLNGSGASQNIGIVFNKTNSPAKAHGIQVNNATGDLIFYDYTGSAERLRVRSDGRVSIASSLAVVGVTTAAAFIPSSGQLGNKNLVINGAMNIAQRATSSTDSGYKTIDRIKVDHGNLGQTCTISQRALTSSDTGPWALGFRNCLKMALASADTAAANKYLQWGYRIESNDLVTSGWDYGSASSYLTVSFWLKVSAAQTFYLMIAGNNTGTNRYYVKAFTPSGTSWEKITMVIPGDGSTTGFDTDNGIGANFWIMPYYGTDYTATGTLNSWHDGNASTSMPDMASTWLTTGTPVFEVTGYQIEVGSVATPFEHLNHVDELAKCQRYCWVSTYISQAFLANGTSWNSDSVGGVIHLPVPMRADPSVTFSSGDDFESTMVFSNTDTLSGGMSRPYSSAPPFSEFSWRGINSGAFTTGQGVILRYKHGETGGKITAEAEL